MGWLVDYINTYNLWDVLYTDYCQIVFKGAIIELINYISYEPIMNHLKYHYWEQLNILEVNDTFPQYEPDEYRCSICNGVGYKLDKFCKHCGANMQKEAIDGGNT